ncbi:hypothetical protein V6U90_33440, partial [Micromonospora sp. CPCC 206060]|uniref:hypothetical protein n=1 Tax=Micromonospora sp. CPCC 206060 TaxID=3122406 RepID=UPI002FEF4E64
SEGTFYLRGPADPTFIGGSRLRTLLMPLLFVVLVMGAFNAGGSPSGSLARTSIEVAATRKLHAAGIR